MSGGSQLELVFASWSDEDLLVAEIWSGDTYLADVVQRPEGLVMTMRSAGPLVASFRVEELEQLLEAVRRRFGLSAAPGATTERGLADRIRARVDAGPGGIDLPEVERTDLPRAADVDP